MGLAVPAIGAGSGPGPPAGEAAGLLATTPPTMVWPTRRGIAPRPAWAGAPGSALAGMPTMVRLAFGAPAGGAGGTNAGGAAAWAASAWARATSRAETPTMVRDAGAGA